MVLNREHDHADGEVFQLRQEFDLFDPSRTQKEVEEVVGQNINTFNSQATLFINGVNLRFLIQTHASRLYKSGTFTPFNPEDGVVVTPDQFDLQERIRQAQQPGEDIDFGRNPLYIEVMSRADDLGRAGIITLRKPDNFVPGPSGIIYEPGFFELLNLLRLRLSFPGSQVYDAEGGGSLNTGGFLWFRNFYPADLRPFPTGANLVAYLQEGMPVQEVPEIDLQSVSLGLRKGLSIALPSDQQRLKTIKGMFFLAPKPGEVPNVFEDAFK